MSDLTRLLCALPAFAYGPLVWVMTRWVARNDFRPLKPGAGFDLAFWLWMIYPGIVGGCLLGDMALGQWEVFYRSWAAFGAAIVGAISLYAHWMTTAAISDWAVAAIRRDIDTEAGKRVGSARETKDPAELKQWAAEVETEVTNKIAQISNGKQRVHTWEEIMEWEVVKRISVLAGVGEETAQ